MEAEYGQEDQEPVGSVCDLQYFVDPDDDDADRAFGFSRKQYSGLFQLFRVRLAECISGIGRRMQAGVIAAVVFKRSVPAEYSGISNQVADRQVAEGDDDLQSDHLVRVYINIW